MSHFTKIQTKLYNLDILKKTLSSLNLDWAESGQSVRGYKDQVQSAELVIKQANNYDIGFKWNGSEYELVADLMFWDQPYSVDKFLNQVNQRYAYQTIVEVHEEGNFTFTQATNEKTDAIHLQLTRYVA
uniref:Uncharacterized protein ycf35 n=2 Tax=Isochrysidaceae TaxID=418951 RepID=A0A3Q8CWW2_9EUKA|nr:Ycf35 [Tisochrysis lutea]YP_009873585.1 hypothetical chloroplast RF35 [Isochrysis galbana]AUM82501.1 Ycf35 [Tisochrysis lutea]QKW88468.1 hypothetical chloroplast RF35 [Isochrysis galbana]